MKANRAVAGAAAVLLLAGVGAALAQGTARPTRPVAAPETTLGPTTTTTTTTAPASTTTSTIVPTTIPVPTPPEPAFSAMPVLPTGPVAQLGCPPPPAPSPPPPTTEPWHPAVLVPDSQLPQPTAPHPWASDPRAAFGKGMWVWMWNQTESGDADAVVRRAIRAGLHQLWVRVGDSQDGFYAAPTLTALVAKAHAAQLSVIGWGFPHLYDPLGDATWTNAAMDWRGPAGETLDGFSADIERPSEGVMLSARRAAVYLEAVRRHVGNRLVIATVYPPIDSYWNGDYPFSAMAPYVDAFAPMIYWECTDPGADAQQAVARLRTLRPVHLIGQGYDMAGSPGGRADPPSAAETLRFMDVGQRAGAIGVSFWVWNTMDTAQWGALSSYPWRP